MKRILVFGSLFTIILFLCISATPAVHVASNEPVQSSLQNVALNYSSDDIKHPILYYLVYAHMLFRIYRSGIFLSIHLNFNQEGLIAELALFRFVSLAYNTIVYLLLWDIISDKLGWNWNIFELEYFGT